MTTLRRITTAFLVLTMFGFAQHAPAQPAEPEREIAIVVRVSLPEAFDTNGREVRSSRRHLERAVRQLAALRDDELGAVPYALSFAGVVCDELQLLKTSAARRLIRELKLQARAATVLSSAHADVRLSDIGPSDIATEVERGRSGIEACTGVPPRNLFVPPDLTLPDEDILRPMRGAGAVAALSAFAVPLVVGRPTIVPAVELPSDADLRSLLAARPDSASIAVVVDTSVHDVAAVLRRLSDDERFALRSVGALAKLDVVRGVIDPAKRSTRAYRRAVADARDALGRFESFTLPDNRLAAVFETVIARVRSSAAWGPAYDMAMRRAKALTRTIERQEGLVSVAGGSVTFTSSRGSIPVTVANRAPYPVRVQIEVSSPKLRFPAGEARVVTIDPPGDTITFDAIARSTGSFPTSVAVKSQRGDRALDTAELTVRSTAANVSAVVLTAGGALFLVAWFLRRIRQRHPGEAS